MKSSKFEIFLIFNFPRKGKDFLGKQMSDSAGKRGQCEVSGKESARGNGVVVIVLVRR